MRLSGMPAGFYTVAVFPMPDSRCKRPNQTRSNLANWVRYGPLSYAIPGHSAAHIAAITHTSVDTCTISPRSVRPHTGVKGGRLLETESECVWAYGRVR